MQTCRGASLSKLKPSTLLIGIFYPLIVVFAVLLLAVLQLRSSADASYDIWRLNYKSTEALSALLNKEADTLRKSINDSADDMNFANYCLTELADEKFKKDVIDGAIGQRVKAVIATGDKESMHGDELCIARGVAGSQFWKTTGENKKKLFEQQLLVNQNKITETDERHSDLVRGHQDFLAFAEMEKSTRWYVNLIATTPYDLFVLLLVMFMGALGGMVRLLRDYGDTSRVNPQPRDYFFIPLIGMVVAIGGYILAKTGLLLLSSTKQETSLSPFMIGLVGIVSGLLAREVIDAIARAGSSMMHRQQDSRPAKRRGVESKRQ